ncbi:P-loop containing nucleoside triphosphate hydrolase protein [Cyathus striatus]|nr:P-loop containing nucleoside triphosphate hydrolase protein [Cyathus striatus]
MGAMAQRNARLLKVFTSVLGGRNTVSVSQKDHFLEGLCAQEDPATAVGLLIASNVGLQSLQAAMRFDLGNTFLNGNATHVLTYLKKDEIKKLDNGRYLEQVILAIVEPPIFWVAFRSAFDCKNLDSNDTRRIAFAWLLLQLVSLSDSGKSLPYRDLAQEQYLPMFLSSSNPHVKTIGNNIKNVLDTTGVVLPDAGQAPGGRHDNDFADFRQIALLPTASEINCKEPPFLRSSEVLEDPKTKDSRVAIYLDSQFRLLREDMLSELRDELQIALKQKSGKHRGLVLENLKFRDIHFGYERRDSRWSVTFSLKDDLPQLKKLKPKDRKKYLVEHPRVLSHQSLGCLISGNQIIAFPSIHRDEDQLCKDPPILTLLFEGELSTTHALREFKSLPLSEELLYWEDNSMLRPPSIQATQIINILKMFPLTDLQPLLKTPKSIVLAKSQLDAYLAGLTQRVSLIQGPPGTGKSFIGALLAKTIHDFTSQSILVVCYTNHALDQFLEDLLDIGISADSIVRLGGKSTTRTAPLALQKQQTDYKLGRSDRMMIDQLKAGLKSLCIDRFQQASSQYKSMNVKLTDLLDFLEFEEPGYYHAFQVTSIDSDGLPILDRKGHPLDKVYLLNQWIRGWNPGLLAGSPNVINSTNIWNMNHRDRQAKVQEWKDAILGETISNLYSIATEYNQFYAQLTRKFSEKDISILRNKRIIGCTTTTAAKYADTIQAASPDVLLVEEAGEILESHILSALGKEKKQLILIGDHKQLRPKANSYALTVEKGDGYNFNMLPHGTLNEQHRMRPEIASFVRELTYPELINAPSTQNRPSVRGIRSNVIYIHHSHPEDDNSQLTDAVSSKQNTYEVEMVLKIVRYLAQQGQLQNFLASLKKDTDPILNDLDSFDLVRAGLVSPTSTQVKKNPIRLATIDNYQGEESDIVIASLTRSNSNNDIGFMSAPERLNVLLSRARNGLIMIGNSHTFKNARKGKELWTKFFDLLSKGNYMYDGFPVRCERHPDREATLKQPQEFEIECPDGGCKEPCGTKLSCGLHDCPSKCHQLYDHSKMLCPPPVCIKCKKNTKAAEKRQREELKREQKRNAEQLLHDQRMAEIEEKIKAERALIHDAQLAEEREAALHQKQQELAEAHRLAVEASTRKPHVSPVSSSPDSDNLLSQITPTPETMQSEKSLPTVPQSRQPKESPSEVEWKRQKVVEGADNQAIDSIMEMSGLEDVKEQVLRIKAKIDTATRQNVTLKGERFNIVLLGNPGTGKTTVARNYASFLASVGVLQGNMFEETTGSRLANDGVSKIEKKIDEVIQNGGGTIFIDEAYQLTSEHNFQGKQVLDFLLAEMENKADKIVFIFAGYTKEMEKFFEHNPGLKSRVPYELKFDDYTDEQLLHMFRNYVDKEWNGRMKIEGGEEGLFTRIMIRRLGRGRGRPGFGNARALQNLKSRLRERQAERLQRERRNGGRPDDFLLTQEDLIGPDPTTVMKKSAAWKKLQDMIGLKSVKDSVAGLFSIVGTNYQRELKEKSPLQFSLNRAFIGSPGTGKTTVAQLYGEILKDLAMLSNGEVILKNPADFVGSVLGESERKTKAILTSSVGKVLVIDEAYMLYTGTGGTGNQSDIYKTAVIDTIVAEVQSTPGEDRCVLLLGYKEQIEEMFQNQDLEATDEAKRVAIEYLSRERNRPNFGNGGAVENILGTAKYRCQSRQISSDIDIILQPEDFDPDFNRGHNASANLAELFKGTVGCEDIIKQLSGYQKIAASLRGPNGMYRKTTTARKMGQVFYDMGLLSSRKVIECSASDLVGQYIGQTGPKTQKKFEQALGQVLFIDEAYRLAEGHFAQEAMDELVGILTNEKFKGKMVVILAGYDQDINRLMQVNSGLTSRFPETVLFKNMTTKQCLEMLDKELLARHIHLPALVKPSSPSYLSKLSSWGNGRDVKTLGTQMVRKALEAAMDDDIYGDGTLLSDDLAIVCIAEMLQDRQERESNVSTRSARPGEPQIAPQFNMPSQKKEESEQQSENNNSDHHGRDPGVSNKVWKQLQRDKQAYDMFVKRSQDAVREMEEKVKEEKRKEAEIRAHIQKLEQRKKREREQAALEELKRKQEAARLKELAKKQEAMVQQKLRDMGVCEVGYQWIPTEGGYRCAGGWHFVSNNQLGI